MESILEKNYGYGMEPMTEVKTAVEVMSRKVLTRLPLENLGLWTLQKQNDHLNTAKILSTGLHKDTYAARVI